MSSVAVASDLRDQVIGDLFALGTQLQGDAARNDPGTATRVNGYADTVDGVIGNIRSSIFGLQRSRRAAGGPQARVMEVIEEHGPQLGFTATPRSSRARDAAARPRRAAAPSISRL